MTETQPAATAFDLDAMSAIDMHVHIEQDSHGCFALDDELMDASAAYFKASEHRAPTLEHVAAYYRQQGMAAVVFTVDAGTATGHPTLSSEEIADQAAAHPDVLIPFGSVDPHAGAAAVAAGPAAGHRPRRPRVQVPPQPAGLRTQRPGVLPAVRSAAASWACRRCSTPGRPGSAPACPAGGASSCGTPRRC